jgi:type VI secretion system protein ImpJ
MSWDNRVIWSEGTFLQPQHLQQHDRYLEAYVELRTRGLRPYSWGFLELEIDESLLELGKLAIRSARGGLPDGTPFDCPARDPLPPPLDIPATLRDSLVMLALPVRRPGVDEADLSGGAGDGLARYVAGELEVKDTNASFDRTALIQIGRLRLQLLKETDVTSAYTVLGGARVVERQADNRVVLDRRYIPPMMDVGADQTLAGIVRDIHGLLHQRGDALAARMSQPGPGGVGEIAESSGSRRSTATSRSSRTLNTAPLHPERLYAALSRAGRGALHLYSGEPAPVPYPVYRHDDPPDHSPPWWPTSAALSMVLERNAIPIPLEDRKNGLLRRVHSGRRAPSDGPLRARGQGAASDRAAAGQSADARQDRPGERIRDLVNLNLPGIVLRSLPVAPRQIPFHAGFYSS